MTIADDNGQELTVTDTVAPAMEMVARVVLLLRFYGGKLYSNIKVGDLVSLRDDDLDNPRRVEQVLYLRTGQLCLLFPDNVRFIFHNPLKESVIRHRMEPADPLIAEVFPSAKEGEPWEAVTVE